MRPASTRLVGACGEPNAKRCSERHAPTLSSTLTAQLEHDYQPSGVVAFITNESARRSLRPPRSTLVSDPAIHSPAAPGAEQAALHGAWSPAALRAVVADNLAQRSLGVRDPQKVVVRTVSAL